MAVNPCRIYSYVSEDTYSALRRIKDMLISDGYNVNFSMIIRLALMEFLKKDEIDIKKLLL